MKKEELFNNLEDHITKIHAVLSEIEKKLPNKGLGDQKITDLQQGLVKQNGIYIPLESISHKILFNGIENVSLNVFIRLFDKLFNKPNEEFSQFALRTLLELGFERIQILYDDKITENERNKYKVLLLLADYAMVSEKYENKRNFIKLLQEYKNLFKETTFNFFTDLISRLHTLTPIEKHKMVVKARKRISSTQQQLVDKTTLLPFMRALNVVSFSDNMSHLLHGNILLLNNVFKDFNTSEQKLRVYWSLILSGLNVINRIGKSLKNVNIKKIEEINKEFAEITKMVECNWDKIKD